MVEKVNKDERKEKMMKVIRAIVAGILFIGAMIAIFVGQKHIGPRGLGLMLAGLAVIIFLLYRYNRRFK